MTKKCDNPQCDKEIDDLLRYCSERCDAEDYRRRVGEGRQWTTLSLRTTVRDKLKSIRDDLHSKGHKEFGYSDVITAIIKLLELIIFEEDVDPLSVGDFIISNIKELK